MLKECPLCKSKDSLLFIGNIKGYVYPLSFGILHCKNCETRFSEDLRVDESLYSKIYSSPLNIEGYERYLAYKYMLLLNPFWKFFFFKSEEMYASVAKLLVQNKIRKEHKILEVGCGLGYLTAALRRLGYQCDGIDLSDEAVKKATRSFGDFYTNISLEAMREDQKYDVVISLEVIEHVSDPSAFVKSCMKKLKPGGIFVVSTPNGDPEVIKNSSWISDPPPVHLWLFSQKSMKTIFQTIGCDSQLIPTPKFSKQPQASDSFIMVNNKNPIQRILSLKKILRFLFYFSGARALQNIYRSIIKKELGFVRNTLCFEVRNNNQGV